VLVPTKESTSEGGASLVAHQLIKLIGEENVLTEFGSISNKTRVFADRQMVARIDRDSSSVLAPGPYWNQILKLLWRTDISAVVVGDYGKGALGHTLASGLNAACLQKSLPLFVDAKGGVQDYKGCYAIFPNENEHKELALQDYPNVIRKLGPRGCTVNGRLVATQEQQVFDVTGA
jgi:bifunctional ADP-heptose synthase (sugar kinase/adenylyltransferase)